ncbi:MAG: hemerythrin domain-containing protein, partial [Nitrospira sp.]
MGQRLQSRGAIAKFLVSDHQRLEVLFRAAVANPDQVDHESYTHFRAGLLRHIGMEEKILLPAIQQRQGGNAWPLAAKLRLDHGALASLLMSPPRPAIVAMLQTILEAHNELEEGANGLYAAGDELVGPESEQLVARLKAAPLVSVMPY